MNPSSRHSAICRIAAVVAALLVLWAPAILAQSNVDDTPGEVDHGDSTAKADDTSDAAKAESAEKGESKPSDTPADLLRSKFGIEQDIIDNPDAIEAYLEQTSATLTESKKRSAALEKEVEAKKPVVQTLAGQVENTRLPQSARAIILQDLARAHIDVAKARGGVAALGEQTSRRPGWSAA